MFTRRPLWILLAPPLSLGLVLGLTPACDSKEEPDLGLPETKNLSDLKKSNKNEMSKEELEEARRKAGFKDQEELEAEARAAYEASEKSFVKGRADRYKKLLASLRKHLDNVEKQAPKWAKAKDPDAAFGKFNDKYKEEAKAFLDEYDELTEKGSRGGDMQAALNKIVSSWENLNGDLAPQIAEAEGFPKTLEELRKALDEVEKAIDEIAKDESIEAEEGAEAGGDAKKK